MTRPAPIMLDDVVAASLLPQRLPRGHKGTHGRVVMIAGSLDYAGAALLAGAAALRAGSGLVTLCVPASLQPVIAGRVPELITHGLPQASDGQLRVDEAVADVLELPADALLIGPGLRPDRATTRLVQAVLAAEHAPAVVDAGAIAAIATVPGWSRRLSQPVVLTPHPGEFARLGRNVDDADEVRLAGAVAAAAEWGQVVVLKGARTVIADVDGSAVVAPFETPALGTAGTGDVLAGVIASLIGQGLRAVDAATLGVYLHGRAGEHVSETLGDAGLLASDLLVALPRVRRHLSDRRDQGSGSLGFSAPVRSP